MRCCPKICRRCRLINGASRWKTEPKHLFMSKEALMRHGAERVTTELYPEQMEVDGVKLPLKYHFEPGHPLDGVTVSLLLALLNL